MGVTVKNKVARFFMDHGVFVRLLSTINQVIKVVI